MKDINSFINESKTSERNIQNYGKSWTTEYVPEDFTMMFNFFLKGVKEGLEDNKKAYKDNNVLLDYVEESLKMISEVEKIVEKY